LRPNLSKLSFEANCLPKGEFLPSKMMINNVDVALSIQESCAMDQHVGGGAIV